MVRTQDRLEAIDRADALIEAGRARLRRAADRFERRGDERLQARELLEHAAGRPIADGTTVDARTRRLFARFVERRVHGEPIPYIRGYEEFYGLRLAVKPGAFIPRLTTEALAEQAIWRLEHRTDPIAADLATGVGAVALAMAHAFPRATVYGTDISKVALSLARANARSEDVPNVRFLAGSMFDPLPRRLRGSIDVITSHPPYVAVHELRGLPAELIDYEPVESLTDSSRDGLGLVRLLVAGARNWLRPGGWLCIEIASDLARPVRSMLMRAGYRSVRSRRDAWPETRVLVARR